jgi:lipid-A-disaccharide synthase
MKPLRVALVAGEASGDLLGAALIDALKAELPGVVFEGVAGPRMVAAGCRAIAGADELSVMGLSEVLRHLPRLLRLRRGLLDRFGADPPAVFVGIDSPEFNLGLASRLKVRGLATVQYVSPQVWAWRQGRVEGIARSVDLVLCLLPFEVPFYARHSVSALFVGHPLADQVPLQIDRSAARESLGIDAGRRVVALLPGSRLGEVDRLGADFAAAAVLLARRCEPAPLFIAPMASPAVRQVFERQVAKAGADIRLLDGRSREALAAADAVLVASGTATLETLLHKRPMVVAYRLAPLTAWIVRTFGLVKVRYFSQPNLLAGEALVPELLQEGVTPEALAAALEFQLVDADNRARLERRFGEIHLQLRQDGAVRAARAIADLVRSRTGVTA